jgi:hypothetical protein
MLIALDDSDTVVLKMPIELSIPPDNGRPTPLHGKRTQGTINVIPIKNED